MTPFKHEEKIDTRKVGTSFQCIVQYEKPTQESVSKVSTMLGSNVVSTSTYPTTEKQDESIALKDVAFQPERKIQKLLNHCNV